MDLIRQVWRGLGTLPHVGSHPGWPVIVLFEALAFIGGMLRGELWRGILAAGVMATLMLPMLCWGAYDRAIMSDWLEQISQRRRHKSD